VRWLAPGDDIAFPLGAEGEPERLFHAESSGAAALAAGVLLLVLGVSPRLRLGELAAVVDTTLTEVAPEVLEAQRPLADPADALPPGRDGDGHNARHGLGLLSAADACLFAADPVCAALLRMGEREAARAWGAARVRDPAVAGAYSPRLARWAVRAMLADPALDAALRVVLRHVRLVAGHEDRARAHGEGALTRQMAWILRRLAASKVPTTAAVRAEAHGTGLRLGAHLVAERVATGAETRFDDVLARTLYPLIAPPVPS
jgi:hypothetical protein